MAVKIEVSREELAKRKLMLGVPMYGGVNAGIFCRSAMDLACLMQAWGVQIQLYFLFNESLITRARNYIADEFLRSDCTHLMFIDSDIGFHANDVMAMLALATDESEYDVLTAPYPKKSISWEKIKAAVDRGAADNNPNDLEKFVGDFVFNPLPGVTQLSLGEPVEVLEAGTGFMLIQRRAFEKFKAYRPELAYKPDHVRTDHFDGSRYIHAYFMDPIDKKSKEKDYRAILEEIAQLAHSSTETAVELANKALAIPDEGSERLLSEDYFFCQEVRKAGAKVWLCPWMKLQHVGSYVFSGSLADLASIGASATADPGAIGKGNLAAPVVGKAAALRQRTKGLR